MASLSMARHPSPSFPGRPRQRGKGSPAASRTAPGENSAVGAAAAAAKAAAAAAADAAGAALKGAVQGMGATGPTTDSNGPATTPMGASGFGQFFQGIGLGLLQSTPTGSL